MDALLRSVIGEEVEPNWSDSLPPVLRRTVPLPSAPVVSEAEVPPLEDSESEDRSDL